MLSPYVRELSIGDMVCSSVRLYRTFFLPVLLCYLIPNIPGTILLVFALLADSVPLKLLALAAFLVCGVFGYTGIIFCISDACTGNKPSYLRSLARGRIALLSLTLVWLLMLPVLFIGFALLIIPGLILTLWFLYVPLVTVLERRSVWSAIKRSRQLSMGFNMRNFRVLVIGALMLFSANVIATLAISTLASAIARFGRIGVAGAAMGFGYLGCILFSYATYPVVLIMIVLTYYDIRARKEGYDSMALAAELGR